MDKNGFLSPEDFAKHLGIPLQERSETASGRGKKNKTDGDLKAQGDTSRVAEQTCTFEDINGSDGEYIIEKYSSS